MGFYLPMLYNRMLKASLRILKNKKKAFSASNTDAQAIAGVM